MNRFQEFDPVTILSVDDDGFNQELASAIFEDYKNIKVIQAGHGKEAISLLEKEVVDIILLDLIMPEMNGMETLKYLKESPEYRNIPVIVVTSKEEEKKATYQLGANDFISKPYSPEELKLRVFNHLRIKVFSDLIYEIKDDSDATSENQLSHLKRAIEIAIGSQKKLLEKLGNMAHENRLNDGNSSKRMGEYAKLMGELHGLNSKEADNIYYCMAIYDIGLLRLSKEERKNSQTKAFKEYPLLGVSVLDGLEETTLIKMAKEVILSHQENWDGSGYPKGVKGEAIPLYAQIASIAHLYDELTISKVYSPKKCSSEEALETIKRESGVKFNPALLALFVENFEQFKEIKNRLS